MLAQSKPNVLKHTQIPYLPFLYSTSTIHHTRPVSTIPSYRRAFCGTRSNSRAEISRRRKRGASYQANIAERRGSIREELQGTHKRVVDIPFERPQRERRDGYSELELEGSTITPNERKAFEGLFRLQRNRDAAGPGETKVRKVGVGKRMRNDDGDVSGTTQQIGGLENAQEESGILDEDGRRKAGMPAVLRKLAREAREKEIEPSTPDWNQKSSATPVQNKQEAALSRDVQRDVLNFSKALASAKSDAEIWQLLQTRILSRIPKQNKPPNPGEAAPGPSKEIQLPRQTLPIHLTNTFTHLLAFFPASNLPLSILPALRHLGQHAVALGASTQLYNLHLRLLFAKYPTSLHSILSTLQEAEQQPGWQYDEETVAVLDDILVYAREVQEGKFGEAARVVWGMESMVRALREIVRVKHVAVGRVQENAVARAREREGSGIALN